MKELNSNIVVIGGGGAGLSAAVSAAEKGATKIMILEDSKSPGGNSQFPHGIFGAETKLQRCLGIIASKDHIFKKSMKYAHFKLNAGLVTRIYWKFKQVCKDMWDERFEGGEYMDKVPYMKGRRLDVHGSEGDTVIAKGYVTDKYINQRDEHTIDLTCWGETLDNKIIQSVAASAKLPSKSG